MGDAVGIQAFTQIAIQRSRLIGKRNRLLKVCGKLTAELEASRREIAELEAQITAFNAVLAHQDVDVDPDNYKPVRPTPRKYQYFAHGQQTALALDALRTARRPVSTPAVLDYMVAAADIRWKLPSHRYEVRDNLLLRLCELARRELIVRVRFPGQKPGDAAWWALPQYAHLPPTD